MKRNFGQVALTILFVVILGGCAINQLPPVSKGQGALAIPKTEENTSFEGWIRRYALIIKKVEGGRVKGEEHRVALEYGGEAFQLEVGLEPGNYMIERMVWAGSKGWRAPQGMGEGYPLDIPVTVIEPQVTILPIQFDLRQQDSGGGLQVWFGVDYLNKDLRQQIQADLKALPNSEAWSVPELNTI